MHCFVVRSLLVLAVSCSCVSAVGAEEAARLPVFQLVDAVEVANGGNTARENLFALRVARVLGKPGTGGSDAHSSQGVGIFTTVFERTLQSQEQMIEELRAGRFHPTQGLPQGKPVPVSEETLR